MQKIILLSFFMSLAGVIFGQKEAKGFVIDINNTKIVGKITGSNPSQNSSRIVFTNATTGARVVYNPSEIKSWQSGEVVYESKVYMVNSRKGFTVFMRRLCDGKGKVKLYEYWNTDGEHAFNQTFLERDGKMTEVEYGRFRKFMSDYFKDYDLLKKKIDDKEFKKKDILDIIAEYNAWREYQWN